VFESSWTRVGRERNSMRREVVVGGLEGRERGDQFDARDQR